VPSFGKEGQGGFADVCPNQGVRQILLGLHFSKSEPVVHEEKWKVSGGVIGVIQRRLQRDRTAKAGSSKLVNVGVAA
jgi:hypothetical protein